MNAVEPVPGTIIGGQFELIEFIGEGASSNVWKARQCFLDRSVAIKMLKRRLLHNAEDYRRIRNEARSLRRLAHSNIPRVYALGEWHESFFIVVDFIDGHTLQDELNENKPLSVERSLFIAAECLEALGHAHAQGIVHRDIKPSNIMLTRDSNGRELVKLVDFGIAKDFDLSQSGKVTSTQTVPICGSPYYMSPEQCTGRKVDQRTDIYSFACVLHAMLASHPPFDGESALAVMMKHTSEPFPLIDDRLAVPPGVQSAILRAAVKDRDLRLQTAQEFIDALNDTVDQVHLPALQASSAKRRLQKGYFSTALSTVLAVGVVATCADRLLWCSTEDQYKRLSEDLVTRRVDVSSEIERLEGMPDKNAAARLYVDLIDATAKLDEQAGGTRLDQVCLSAARFMRQIPGVQERLDLRGRIEQVLQTMQQQQLELPADALTMPAELSGLRADLTGLLCAADHLPAWTERTFVAGQNPAPHKILLDERCHVLQWELNTMPDDSPCETCADVSGALADAYFDRGNLPAALRALDQGTQLVGARQNSSHSQAAIALLEVHKAELMRNDLRLQEALSLAETGRDRLMSSGIGDDFGMAVANSVVGTCQMQLGKRLLAKTSIKRAIASANRITDSSKRNLLLLSMSQRCSQSEMLDESIVIYSRMTEVPYPQGDAALFAYWQLGDQWRLKGDLKRAGEAYEVAYLVHQQNAPPALLSQVQSILEQRLAELAQDRGDQRKAWQHMRRSVDLVDKNQVDPFLCEKLGLLAGYLHRDKRKVEADKVAQEAWAIARSFPLRSEKGAGAGEPLPLSLKQISCLYHLSRFYALSGQKRKALAIFDGVKPYLLTHPYRNYLRQQVPFYLDLVKGAGRADDAAALLKNH